MRLIDRVRWRRRACLTWTKVGMGIGLAIATASLFLTAPGAAPFGMALAAVCFLAPTFYIAWLERPLLRKLQAHGYALCTGCGYPLEGRPTDTCPECGVATTIEAATCAWHNLVKNREGFGEPNED